MNLTRVERRCDHGFLVGSGLCETCDGTTQKRNDNKVTRTEVIVPGRSVGGATIIRALSNGRVEVRCRCGQIYEATRPALIKARARNGRASCPKCRTSKPQSKESAA